MLRSDVPGHDAYAPGVYYEEAFEADASAPFRTGVPVFIGCATGARASNEPGLFYASRWEEFERRVPALPEDYFLRGAVRGFFENGGERCAVLTVLQRNDLTDTLCRPLAAGSALEDLEDVDLVCLPDAMRADLEGIYRIQEAALEHCARTSRFAILDSVSPSRSQAQAIDADALLTRVREQRDRLPRAREGALYFPWVHVDAKLGARPGMRRLVPPCGHVAGVYARVDATQGAHKAPANEILEGVVDLELAVPEEQHVILNELGVNCLRSFTARGIRVYGARTLSGQSNWRFVNVTRLFLTLARWMTYELSDLVFEPHTPALWDSVRDRLTSYCLTLREQGALQGTLPEQAFFVKCDAETNPGDFRENGIIVVEVGLAPAVPAEFIVVRVTQRASGATFTPSTGL